jgi:hypothetical protein
MAYTGSSIVDYLKSIGVDSSFSARARYAANYGISNYQGTAEQNLQLLNLMRSSGGATAPAPAQAPATSTSSALQQAESQVSLLQQSLAQQQEASQQMYATLQKQMADQQQQAELQYKAQQQALQEQLKREQERYDQMIAEAQRREAEAAARYGALSEQVKQAQQETARLKSEKLAKVEQYTSQYEDLIANRQPIAQLLSEQQAKWQVPELYDKLLGYTDQMAAALQQVNDLKAAEQEALAQSEQRLAPITYIRGEQALIQDKYARQIANATAVANAQAVLIEATRGNLTTARQFAQDMVAAATYDYERQVQDLQNLITVNYDLFNSLSQQEQQYLSLQLGITQALTGIQEQYFRDQLGIKEALSDAERAYLSSQTDLIGRLDASTKAHLQNQLSLIQAMNAENQNYLNIQLQVAQNELDYQRNIKSQIAQLMVTYPDAGISYDMSFDQALNLARSAASQQQAWERSIQEQQLEIQRLAAEREEGTSLSTSVSDYWANILALNAIDNNGKIDTSILPADIQKDTNQLTTVLQGAQSKLKDVNWLKSSGVPIEKLKAAGIPQETINTIYPPAPQPTPVGAGEVFAQMLGLGERTSSILTTIKKVPNAIVKWWTGS